MSLYLTQKLHCPTEHFFEMRFHCSPHPAPHTPSLNKDSFRIMTCQVLCQTQAGDTKMK